MLQAMTSLLYADMQRFSWLLQKSTTLALQAF